MDRRQFLLSAGALGLASAFPKTARANSGKVLVLGGTRYLGPVIVQELLNQGFSVTLFNRGKTNPHLFPSLPKIRGDREQPGALGLSSLKADKTQWDWVIDTWQGSSKCVEDTAKLLANRTNQYQYVSTVSVYDQWDKIGIKENEPLNPLPTDVEPLSTANRYAIRKTFSETVLNRVLPKHNVCFRSHGLRGHPTSAAKHEPYWQVKVKRGGDLLLPSDVEYYQVTDMISLARFMIHCGIHKHMGPYNVSYPPMLFKFYIEEIIKTVNSDVKLHWVPHSFLLEQKVELLRKEPIGRYRFDVTKALDDGLKNRPLSELFHDQLAGYYQRHPKGNFIFGQQGTSTISEAQEQAILERWNAHLNN
jgi:2'-hydroxyisoflavone reductase